MNAPITGGGYCYVAPPRDLTLKSTVEQIARQCVSNPAFEEILRNAGDKHAVLLRGKEFVVDPNHEAHAYFNYCVECFNKDHNITTTTSSIISTADTTSHPYYSTPSIPPPPPPLPLSVAPPPPPPPMLIVNANGSSYNHNFQATSVARRDHYGNILNPYVLNSGEVDVHHHGDNHVNDYDEEEEEAISCSNPNINVITATVASKERV